MSSFSASRLRVLAQTENVPITDNEILDQWELPFGQWVDQMVAWIDQNMEWLLDIIRWPFEFLLENLVDNFIAEVSWIWVCLAFFVIGSLVRNVRIGATAALALAGCGLLGTNYWYETSRTIGMILVAVLLCALVGIPVGILCGRFDGVWNVVRPTLDAMQVVHAFVYMLPVIFFFSFGVVPGTMVTMIFAIPPLIRLTNLGIRQVPEDVVEASRAFGAPELRVLRDVQLPLARPAIMTGLNQTLLLSISMIGIAAIMGAGGLGLLVFRAVSNLDIALAASAGLALFLVAVVLDRISQPEASDGGSLFSRTRKAWAHRQDPGPLLAEAEANALLAEEKEAERSRGAFAPTGVKEQTGLLVAAVGGFLGFASVFLTWGNDSGLISGYARRVDQDLSGQSFNGLAASGGSWFGYLVFAGGLYVVVSAVKSFMMPGRGVRWFSPDGAALASGVMFASGLGYFLANPSNLNVAYSHGPGPLAATIGGAVALAGCALWLSDAPFSPIRPLGDQIGFGRLIGGIAAVLLSTIALFSAWSFDERADTVLTPEIQAELDEVIRQVEAGEVAEAIAAQSIQRINNSAAKAELIVIDGKSSDGAGLGILSLGLTVVGFGLLLPAVGMFGINPRRQWVWSSLSAAAGFGVMAVGAAWAVSIMRVADGKFFSGAGCFLAFVAGFFLFASSRGLVSEFRRRKVYDEITNEKLEAVVAQVHRDDDLVVVDA